MKKLFILLFFVLVYLKAEVINTPPTQNFYAQHIPIVDIRTPSEWRQTGILKGAIPIMFFDKKGEFDIERFLQQLKLHVDTSKAFALICRTGHRTSIVANFLSKEYNYRVFNLTGGVFKAKENKLPFVPYR